MKAKLREELDKLLKMDERERTYALVTSTNDHLVELLGEERSKFTQSDKSLMSSLIQLLIIREVYPTEWNGKPINVEQRVSGWGADWYKWTGLLNCPHCNADLRAQESGPPFMRTIAVYDRMQDRTTHYKCPDCNQDFPRGTVGSATLHGVNVIILSAPRHIAGGAVVTLTWAQDSKRPEHILPDGTVHPAHRYGFTWEEPVTNLQGRVRQ